MSGAGGATQRGGGFGAVRAGAGVFAAGGEGAAALVGAAGLRAGAGGAAGLSASLLAGAGVGADGDGLPPGTNIFVHLGHLIFFPAGREVGNFKTAWQPGHATLTGAAPVAAPFLTGAALTPGWAVNVFLHLGQRIFLPTIALLSLRTARQLGQATVVVTAVMKYSLASRDG